MEEAQRRRVRGMEEAWRRQGGTEQPQSSYYVVQYMLGGDAEEVRWRQGGGMEEAWRMRGGGVEEAWRRHGGGMEKVQRRCQGGTEQPQSSCYVAQYMLERRVEDGGSF